MTGERGDAGSEGKPVCPTHDTSNNFIFYHIHRVHLGHEDQLDPRGLTVHQSVKSQKSNS